MLAGAEHPHALEASRVSVRAFQAGLERAPHGVPFHTKLLGESSDRGVLGAQSSQQPAHSSGCQQHPGRSDALVLFDERGHGAGGPGTCVAVFVAHQPHRAPERGRIDQCQHLARVGSRNHTAAREAVTSATDSIVTTSTPSPRSGRQSH